MTTAVVWAATLLWREKQGSGDGGWKGGRVALGRGGKHELSKEWRSDRKRSQMQIVGHPMEEQREEDQMMSVDQCHSCWFLSNTVTTCSGDDRALA
ncbi:hypothetical protein GW17_00001380 [Ensete ventricosum]|nr:hypothetical protein GW17_00001380 [Ensete ventricosum]RZS14366.1 hypothetical protein BHM03_00046087 [Ensete ventricosum]